MFRNPTRAQRFPVAWMDGGWRIEGPGVECDFGRLSQVRTIIYIMLSFTRIIYVPTLEFPTHHYGEVWFWELLPIDTHMFLTANPLAKSLSIILKTSLPTDSPWNLLHLLFKMSSLTSNPFFHPDIPTFLCFRVSASPFAKQRCSWCVMQRMEIYWHVGRSEHRWSSKVTWLKGQDDGNDIAGESLGKSSWKKALLGRKLQNIQISFRYLGLDKQTGYGANVAPHDHVIDFPRLVPTTIVWERRGELCARTLPRVLPSVRPALAAGYQCCGIGVVWRVQGHNLLAR